MRAELQTDFVEPSVHGLVADARTLYRCYSMAETGHILALVVIDCADEESVMRLASAKFREDPQCHVVEVWEVGRRISRVIAPAQ